MLWIYEGGRMMDKWICANRESENNMSAEYCAFCGAKRIETAASAQQPNNTTNTSFLKGQNALNGTTSNRPVGTYTNGYAAQPWTGRASDPSADVLRAQIACRIFYAAAAHSFCGIVYQGKRSVYDFQELRRKERVDRTDLLNRSGLHHGCSGNFYLAAAERQKTESACNRFNRRSGAYNDLLHRHSAEQKCQHCSGFYYNVCGGLRIVCGADGPDAEST